MLRSATLTVGCETPAGWHPSRRIDHEEADASLSASLAVAAVDYHAGGEPFRIVEGLPLRGDTVSERRRDAAQRHDHYRRLLTSEPRGHAGMYGGFVTSPDDSGADLGVVFFHKDGFSTACGHGTIALAVWALDSGRLPTRVAEGEQTLRIDVPSGRVQARVSVSAGRASAACFVNVPAWVRARKVKVTTQAGTLAVDVAFGGAFYACLPLPARLSRPGQLPALISLSREIRSQLDATEVAEHPARPDLAGIYGVMFHDEPAPKQSGLALRSVTVFADGAIDRSPCGSGTSALLAVLCDSGELGPGQELAHRGAAGSQFIGRITGVNRGAQGLLVSTEVEGTAYLTGYHHFVLDPRDDLGYGFQLQ